MNPHSPANRIRPGIILLVTCVLAAVLIPIAISMFRQTKPPVTSEIEASLTSAEPMPETQTVAPEVSAEPRAATNVTAPVLSVALEEKWGIQVSSIRLMRSDSAVDVRYRVVVPEKLALLAEDSDRAYLIDQATGTKLQMLAPPEGDTSTANVRSRSMMKMMHLAGAFPPPAAKVAEGGLYSVLLPNWGGALKTGSKVVLVVGDLRTEDLTVE